MTYLEIGAKPMNRCIFESDANFVLGYAFYGDTGPRREPPEPFWYICENKPCDIARYITRNGTLKRWEPNNYEFFFDTAQDALAQLPDDGFTVFLMDSAVELLLVA